MSDAHVAAIRQEVFKRTGMSISPDDPFFAAVAMLAVAAERIETANKGAVNQLGRVAADVANAVDRGQRRQAENLAALRDVIGKSNRASGVLSEEAAARLFAPVLGELAQTSRQLRNKDSFAQDLAQRAQRIAERSATMGWVMALSMAVSLLVVGGWAYRHGVASCIT